MISAGRGGRGGSAGGNKRKGAKRKMREEVPTRGAVLRIVGVETENGVVITSRVLHAGNRCLMRNRTERSEGAFCSAESIQNIVYYCGRAINFTLIHTDLL